MIKNATYLFLLALWFLLPKAGQSQSDCWRKTMGEKNNIYLLDEATFRQQLAQAPLEKDLESLQDGLLMNFPTPEGSVRSFRLFETPIFDRPADKDLLSFKTYTGSGEKNNAYRLKLEVASHHITAFIIGPQGKAWFINPLGKGSYQLKEKTGQGEPYECFSEKNVRHNGKEKSNLNFGGELYIYRLALSASGEYFQFWGNRDNTLAALVRTVNRMNAIFERDLAIRFQLIDDIKFIIFDNPLTDPFELNGNQNVQNQQFLDLNIGADEYDIGHVLMVDPVANGFGSVGSVCMDGKKGRGYSVLPDPSDDDYIIDFLVHELGHQLGGNHTFSHCGNSGGGPIPVEPGSGSTIMAYGGVTLCAEDNFVEHSSPYFHSASIEEIYQFTRTGEGNGCATRINFPNTAPDIELVEYAGMIPYGTPFELSAIVSDAQGDTLSYNWEQMDQAVSLPLGQIQAGSPLFRSWAPHSDPVQSFPSLGSLIAGKELPEERLPDFSGELNFRLTVRDNHFRGGGVSWKETTLGVTNQAGPFRIITAEEPVAWGIGTSQLIQWEVANTNKAPVNISQVDIYLMYDALGQELIKIAGPVANSGATTISLPEDLPSGEAWLKIKGHNAAFFDLSDSSVEIMGSVSSDHQEALSGAIRIYPNPAHDYIFIEKKGGEGMEPAVVEWIDVLGRSIAKKEVLLSEEPVRIDVASNISGGWYLIRIRGKYSFSRKIYIQ